MNQHRRIQSRTFCGVLHRAIAACVICVHAGLTAFCCAQGQSAAPPFDKVGISPSLGTKLPLDLSFVDADGSAIRLADALSKRPIIFHLVYYECPMLCKLSRDGLMGALSTLSRKPGKDFAVVTLSFDPREGPELSARAREMAIERCGREAVEAGWHFLTGDKESIDKLCDAVGFRYTYDEQTHQFAHASGVFIVTAEGVLSRFLSGVDFSPRDLRLALVEASDGKVGTVADQAMLLCYMYDPTTGKYGLAIFSAIRAAGIATVSGLGLAIFVMLRRERRHRAGSGENGAWSKIHGPESKSNNF